MRTFIGLVLWFILFVICWPIALIMLVLFPFVWLILLPFRIVGFTLDVVFSVIKGIDAANATSTENQFQAMALMANNTAAM